MLVWVVMLVANNCILFPLSRGSPVEWLPREERISHKMRMTAHPMIVVSIKVYYLQED